MLRKLIFVLSIFVLSDSYSQGEALDYSRAASYVPTSGTYSTLEQRLKSNIASITVPQRGEVRKIYQFRKTAIEKAIKKGEYLPLDFADSYLQDIYNEILERNAILEKPDLFLIDRDWIPNAYCTGEGLIAINIGLLHRLESESQIAFVLAHELAHWHLNHVNTSTELTIKSFSKKELRNNGLLDDLSKGDISAIRSLIYKSFSHTKENEEQADSLAFEFIKPTRFSLTAYQGVMNTLDSAKYPKFADYLELQNWLFYDSYPFKGKWLRPVERGGLYNENAPSFIFSKDSLATHPNVKDRIQRLDSMNAMEAGTQALETANRKDSLFQSIIDREIIYSSLYQKEFAVCLHLLASRMMRFPDERWQEGVLGELFYQLYLARKNHSFGKHVPAAVPDDHWLYEIATFLNNVRMSEFRKLSYYQFSERTKLDVLSEEQHVAFWEMCPSDDEPRREEIKNSYVSRFPDGKYLNKFQDQE